MSKVFIAISCPEGELNGLQIFSTIEKAEEYCKKQNATKYHNSSYEWYVKECELDKENLDL